MNYKMLSHVYENTGGNCMVSCFTLYDEDEHRTLFVIVNEEGGSLATADYITQDLEYDEDMIIESFNTDDLHTTDNNFELYRYCVNEYIKKDCKHFGNTASLPYEMLATELQQLTPEYIAWHKEEIGSDFETDGIKVIFDSSYKPQTKTHRMKASTYDAIKDLRAAFFRLNSEIDSMYMDWLSDKYPFGYSFDELTSDVADWCDDMTENVTII